MSGNTHRIDTLDIGLFEAIPSQTTPQDRRALLAIQRSVAQKHNAFAYLEIGSHLGGSIQPYLRDERCKKIYSIDPRPVQIPDDREPGYVVNYNNNSSERMLSLLEAACGNVDKIECIDATAPEVDPSRIRDTPEIAFIDGEHTYDAALSDFRFCEKVVSKTGTIVFHDFYVVFPAIFDACKQLRKQGRPHVALKLEGSVFAIFFDAELIHKDRYLSGFRGVKPFFWQALFLRRNVKRLLPKPVVDSLRAVRGWL